jgi:hypothetical protein
MFLIPQVGSGLCLAARRGSSPVPFITSKRSVPTVPVHSGRHGMTVKEVGSGLNGIPQPSGQLYLSSALQRRNASA